MIGLTGTLLLAASLALPAPPEPRRLSLLDVPFISQSEALCGGAAAAMVLRYWGEPQVTAEEFAGLVDRDAGGIRSGDLAAALRARGAHAIVIAGSAAVAQAEIEAGRPVIALIEDRPGAFHYVVLVGWHERALVMHDPARTPYVVLEPAEFERRWQASGNWMLALAPGRPQDLAPTGSDPEGAGAAIVPNEDACGAVVAEGVRLAQQADLGGAERRLAEAVFECPGAAPLRELAGLRLLQRRWPEVRELAGRAVAIDPADAQAWRLLATSRYVQGDPAGALDAWNRAGEPVLDLVSASGLQRTTHRTVERTLGLTAGEVLTRRDLERAERRLAELPAAFATRLEYVARGGGKAEVRAHIAERSVVPRGRLAWALLAARAAASREVAFPINSLAQAGERLEARWRFWPNRPAYGVSLTLAPTAAGIMSLETSVEEQPFTRAELTSSERAGARVQFGDWATGTLRWQARGGIDRWRHEGGFAVVGGGIRFDRGPVELTADTNAWLGNHRFLAGTIAGTWASSAVPRGTVLALRGGVEGVTASAPLVLWPAGDTGHARPTLLRAHPLVDEGRFDVERLGRRVAHVTGEVQRWWRGAGPVALGAAAFVDAAQTARRYLGAPRADVDAGLGLRVAIPGQSGQFRVDFAHGLRDGRNAVSIAWAP